MKINARFTWAIETMAVKPDDRILEIGCGQGVAVSLIAPMLQSGHIVAVDQSRAMISMAMNRNKPFADTKKAVFCEGKFADVVLPGTTFTKIFAFNVNVFLKPSIPEWRKIKDRMARQARFYLFYQTPPETAEQAIRQHAARASQQLLSNGFTIVETIYKQLKPAPALCVIAEA